MADKPCKRTLRKDCSKSTTKDTVLPPCPSVTFCAGNQTITFDGRCVTAVPRGYQIPDGTYTSVTFQDGCVVGVGDAPVAQYTPNQCCPAPGPGDLSGSGEEVRISNNPSNLLVRNADGLSVMPNFRGRGISITGSGTVNDPFILSTDSTSGGGGSFIASGTPESLSVSGEGTSAQNPMLISMLPVVTGGKKNGISFNDYGQITGIDDAGDPPISQIFANSPIVADKKGEFVTLNYEPEDIVTAGEFITRDFKKIKFNSKGIITEVEDIPEDQRKYDMDLKPTPGGGGTPPIPGLNDD